MEKSLAITLFGAILGSMFCQPSPAAASPSSAARIEEPPADPYWPGAPRSDDPYNRGIEIEYFCAFITNAANDGTIIPVGLSRARYCTFCVKDQCNEFFKDPAKRKTCFAVGNANCESFPGGVDN